MVISLIDGQLDMLRHVLVDVQYALVGDEKTLVAIVLVIELLNMIKVCFFLAAAGVFTLWFFLVILLKMIVVQLHVQTELWWWMQRWCLLSW